jgi:hypothetical protein
MLTFSGDEEIMMSHPVPPRFSRVSVVLLAAALAAGCAAPPPIQVAAVNQSWPPVDERMSPANRQCVQALLNALGYEAGPADGVVGSATRTAIMTYQGTVGVRRDGVVSRALFTSLSAQADRRRICNRRAPAAAPVYAPVAAAPAVTLPATPRRTPAVPPPAVRAVTPRATVPGTVAVAPPPAAAPPPPAFVRDKPDTDSGADTDSGSWN